MVVYNLEIALLFASYFGISKSLIICIFHVLLSA